MPLTIDLSPDEEERLSLLADRAGLAPADLVKKLVEEHLPLPSSRQDEEVQAMLAKWQEQDDAHLFPDVPTQTLFARWAAEDAQMTDQEREAEDRLWRDFENGINATRDSLGMRRL